MKNMYRFIAALILFGLLAGCASATPATPTTIPVLTPPGFDTLIPIARNFVSDLASGNFQSAFSRFDITLKASMPLVKLQNSWSQMLGVTGDFQQQTSARTSFVRGNPVVAVSCEFANGSLSILVTFNVNSQIIGVQFTDMAVSIPAPSTF